MLLSLTLSAAIASAAGQHCMDSNLSILTTFPTRLTSPVKLETPSPGNVIVRIDKVEALKRDFPSIVPVMGFVYVLGDGEEYYAPRSQSVLSKQDRKASRAFMLRADALKTATPQALDWALSSSGTASVRIYPTASSYAEAGVERVPCVARPKGQSASTQGRHRGN